MSTPTFTGGPVTAPLRASGTLFAYGLDVVRGMFRRPFQVREFLQQSWFVASVTIIPAALVAIPFGAVIALQVGGLISQFGAQSFTGSAAVLALHLAGAAHFRIPLWYGLLFPLGYSAGALMVLDSVRRRFYGRVSWKGRTYP